MFSIFLASGSFIALLPESSEVGSSSLNYGDRLPASDMVLVIQIFIDVWPFQSPLVPEIENLELLYLGSFSTFFALREYLISLSPKVIFRSNSFEAFSHSMASTEWIVVDGSL